LLLIEDFGKALCHFNAMNSIGQLGYHKFDFGDFLASIVQGLE